MNSRFFLLFSLLLTGCNQLPEMPNPASFDFDLSDTFSLPNLNLEAETEEASNDSRMAEVIEIQTQGLTAWLVEDNSLPLVSIQLMFKGAGSSSDPTHKEGRAMFAAALLDEGAGDLNALEFQQALEDRAIQLSFSTDEDVLIVQLRSLSEHLPEAFRLLGLALNQPSFTKKDVLRKRKLALSTLRQAKTKPGFVLTKEFNALAFLDHPYGATPLGSEKSLASIDGTDLHNYVDQALTKDRLLIAATGNVAADMLEKLMKQHLADLPETSLLPSPPPVTLQHQGVTHIAELNIPQSHVLLATPAVDRQDERFMAAYILNHIIGGDTLTSILGNAIREKKGLAYSVHSYLDPMSLSSNFKVSFATRNEQVHEAYATLKDELVKLGKSGVSGEQFENAIDYITGSFILSLDNNTNYTRYLNTMQRFDLGKDYLQTRNAKMRAVTREQVNALAKEWFDPDKWLVVVVGKPEKLKATKSNNDH